MHEKIKIARCDATMPTRACAIGSPVSSIEDERDETNVTNIRISVEVMRGPNPVDAPRGAHRSGHQRENVRCSVGAMTVALIDQKALNAQRWSVSASKTTEQAIMRRHGKDDWYEFTAENQGARQETNVRPTAKSMIARPVTRENLPASG